MNQSTVKRSLLLAENYFRGGNYQFSEQILKSIIRIDPSNSKANELLAYIYGNQGSSDKSYQLLKLACEKNDCSPNAFYYLGSAQLKRKLYEEASLSFKKSIQMFPDVPENILVVPISLFKKNLKFKNFMHRFGELDESNQSLHSFYFKTTLGTISSENNFLLLAKSIIALPPRILPVKPIA